MPRKIADAPELWPGLEVYFEAWMQMDSCRQVGMSIGPIPWTAIEQYAKAMDLDDQQTARMHRLLRAMDRVYLDWVNKRKK